jgi:hypothetical protein
MLDQLPRSSLSGQASAHRPVDAHSSGQWTRSDMDKMPRPLHASIVFRLGVLPTAWATQQHFAFCLCCTSWCDSGTLHRETISEMGTACPPWKAGGNQSSHTTQPPLPAAGACRNWEAAENSSVQCAQTEPTYTNVIICLSHELAPSFIGRVRLSLACGCRHGEGSGLRAQDWGRWVGEQH